jgi:hypothetical protein
MSATTQPGYAHISVATTRKNNTASGRIWTELELNRFGFVSLLLVVMVCLGGIAAAVAVNGAAWKLPAVAFATVAIEFLVMAVAPMRVIVPAAAIALLINVLVFFT